MSALSENQMQSLAEISNRNIVSFYLDTLRDISLRGIKPYDLSTNVRKKLVKMRVLELKVRGAKGGFTGKKLVVNWGLVQNILEGRCKK